MHGALKLTWKKNEWKTKSDRCIWFLFRIVIEKRNTNKGSSKERYFKQNFGWFFLGAVFLITCHLGAENGHSCVMKLCVSRNCVHGMLLDLHTDNATFSFGFDSVFEINPSNSILYVNRCMTAWNSVNYHAFALHFTEMVVSFWFGSINNERLSIRFDRIQLKSSMCDNTTNPKPG